MNFSRKRRAKRNFFYFQGWFKDLSSLFLSCPVAKLLIIAGNCLDVQFVCLDASLSLLALWLKTFVLCVHTNRTFSKMAAENLNKSKLKTNTSTRKSILNLVTLPSFSISGEISAEKMYVENCKNYRRLYDWRFNVYPQSYKRL